MFELPLFPLNTVLFPGTPLQLHIFEERYQQMINRCVEESEPFGVLLIRQGVEALGPLAEPYDIGCTAQIVHVQRVKEGRKNIVAMGQDRFRLLSLDRESYPYLVGQVEAYPYMNPEPRQAEASADRLYIWVERFIETLTEDGGKRFDLQKLPDDPQDLANVAASLLQVSPVQKQALLSTEQVSDLLESLRLIYRREIALLREMLSPGRSEDESPFSRN